MNKPHYLSFSFFFGEYLIIDLSDSILAKCHSP